MDTITHALLGAVTAQLGFRQRIGRDATWVAAGAAALPDLDIFINPLLSLTGSEADPLGHIRYHRGISHSLLFAPLLAAGVALLWWAVRRNTLRGRGKPPEDVSDHHTPFWLLYLCLLVAIASHGLLDAATSYGTGLFMPLSNTRHAWDAVPIVDIIYTPVLILTLLACYVIRKVAGGRAVRATLSVGWAGFLLSVGYIAAGRLMHDRALTRALEVDPGGPVLTANAYPQIGTIFLWRTVIQTEDRWIVARVHLFDDRPAEAIPRRSIEKSDDHLPWVRKARELPEGRTWEWFTGGRMRAIYAREGGWHVVRLHDMRYGRDSGAVKSLWWLTVVFDQNGRTVRVVHESEYERGSFSDVAGRLWAEIWNPRGPNEQDSAPRR